ARRGAPVCALRARREPCRPSGTRRVSDTVRDVCHDLNNALGAVLMSADLGSKRASTESDRSTFATIAESARRAGELVAKIPSSGGGDDALVRRDLTYLAGLHAKMPPVVEELE